MDKPEALRFAVDALRAAAAALHSDDLRNLAARLEADPSLGRSPRLTGDALDLGADDAPTVNALCALRLVLAGYTVARADEPGTPPPPRA